MSAPSDEAQRAQTLTLAFVVRAAAAQLRTGGSVIFLSDEVPDAVSSYRAPPTLAGTTFVGYLQVEDADVAFSRAVVAGAAPLIGVAEQPWGNREGLVRDPFEHLWALASRK